MNKSKGLAPQDRRPPLTDRQKQLMLMVFLRHEPSFTRIREKLTPAHFTEYEPGYALVWQAAIDCFDRLGELPREETISAEVEKLLHAEDDDYMLEEDVLKILEFLRWTYASPRRDVQPTVAMAYSQQFLEDRLADRIRDTFSAGKDTPTQLFECVTQFADAAAQLQSLDSGQVDVPFAVGWEPRPMVKVATGIPFFDNMLGGGAVPTEAYGLMGPIGSCKTTMGIMLSVCGAQQELERWQLLNRKKAPLGLWYYVQYEEAVNPDILMRALSFSAEIHRSTMENFDVEQLSTGNNNLKPYERAMFAKELQKRAPVAGEKQRYLAARERLNANWRAIDMSGSDPKQAGRGAGLVSELAAVIAGDIAKQPGRFVAGVVIDHVSAACERHLAKHNKDHSEMRHLVSKFPMHAKREIAGHLKCPVWLLHQVSGDANSRSPSAVLHHTDAAESKSFAEFLNVCFTIGNQDSEGRCALALRKGRRLQQRPEIIIQIEGGMNKVSDVNKAYMIEHNRIVPRADVDRIKDDEPAHGKRPPSMLGGGGSGSMSRLGGR